ncbi:MAG: histidine kinase N-terminal 7TM domain-containing protein [Spirochaetota bacterium]
MITQVSIASLYFLGAAFAGAFAFRTASNRSAVALELVGLALCVAEWSFFSGLEALSSTRDYHLLWSQFAYIGTYGSVAFLFRFCVRWLHPRWFGWWMLLLWIVPVVMVVGAFTNALHGLVWTSVRPTEGFDFVYRYGHGPLFWLGIAYQYLLVASSAVLLAFAVARRRGIYRRLRFRSDEPVSIGHYAARACHRRRVHLRRHLPSPASRAAAGGPPPGRGRDARRAHRPRPSDAYRRLE